MRLSNIYAYARGNPVSFVDPLGLDITVCTYTAANPWGHLGAAINNHSSVGYYPAPLESGNPVTGTQGIMKFDDASKKEDCKTVRTTPQQDIKMAEQLAEIANNPGTYTFAGNNCVAAVRLILEAAGLKAPGDIRPRSFLDNLDTNDGGGR